MNGRAVAGFWDRAWAGVYITVVLRPLVGITADHVNRRHAGLVARMPDSWLASHDGPVASDHIGDLEADAVAQTARPFGGPPLRVLVQGDGVAIVFSHGVGDGKIMYALVRDLVAPLDADYVLPTWRRPSQATITLAAVRHWWRTPRRAVEVVRALRDRGGAPAGPAVRDDAVVLLRTLEPDALAALREYRDARHPSVSVSMMLLSLVLDEMAAHGVDVDETFVSVNLRRYLSRPERTAGNLVSIVRLPVPGRTAEDLAVDVRQALDSGLPLAQYLLGSARYLLQRGRPPVVPRATPATLGWSDLGPAEDWDVLPWAPGPRRIVPGIVPSWGRRLGMNVLKLDGHWHFSCLVNTDAFDPDVVAAALDAVVDRLRPVAAPPGGVAS